MMTATALQALRRLLFFSVPEAARLIAATAESPEGVAESTWQQWEDGTQPIPSAIADRMIELNDWRSTALAATADNIRAQIKEKGGMPESVFVIWYDSLEDWLSIPGREATLWRLQQAVCSALMGIFGIVKPVRFDRAAYTAWLAGREDTEAARAEWASAEN